MLKSFVDEHFTEARPSSLFVAFATASVAWLSTISMALVFPQHAHCSHFEAWALAVVFAFSVTFSLYSLLEVHFEGLRRQLVRASLPLITNHIFMFLYFDVAYVTGLSLLPDTTVDIMMALASPLTIALSFRQSQILFQGGGRYAET